MIAAPRIAAPPMARKPAFDPPPACCSQPITYGPAIAPTRPTASIAPTAVLRTRVSYHVAVRLFNAPWPPRMPNPARTIADVLTA